MQLPLTDGRAIRMIVALLAAADPLRRMERGAAATAYEPLAAALLSDLRAGADIRRLMMLVHEHGVPGASGDMAPIDLVRAFAEATLDWWDNASTRWNEPVAI